MNFKQNGLKTTFSSVQPILYVTWFFMTPHVEHIQSIKKNIIILYFALGLDYQQPGAD